MSGAAGAPGRGGGFRPLRSSLDRWTPKGIGTPEPLHAIAAAWPSIVGGDVATNAHPLEIVGSALVIGTRSSAWSQQLQFLSLPILTGIRELACGATIEKLIFRTGIASRRTRRVAGPTLQRLAARRASGAPFEPAASLDEAFARLRRRMTAAAAAATTCQDCGAAIAARETPQRRGPGAAPLRCAPCAGAAERNRTTAVERLVYLAPWLGLEELRAEMPDLALAEFERARKTLLARWWLALERARRAGRLSSTGLERHVASAYVLLQSRLPPDRITPAVIRNLLGTELEALLWPQGAAAAELPRAT